VNYYDSELNTIKIPLNPAISPSANANKYFKDYKKTYTAEQTLTLLTEKDKQELVYFDAVLDSINRCTTLADLQEIREELAETGYIKQIQNKKKKATVSAFKEYESDEGYKILVGKNNKQNDYLTTCLASKQDLWFHTKDIAGSHVIVMCGGNEVSDNTILKAALLAAKNSKAANSSKIAVDYTPVKFVKKPNGAKPGMVIYTTNKTIFVNPTEEE
jgi:predicted ribosome quality control (RQC) complex YloA/Tae2 family protein